MAVKVRTEFAIGLSHKPGSGARAFKSLADAKVNLIAFCGWGHGEQAQLLFVPDNDAKARKALVGAGFSPKESPILCVSGSSGKGAGAKIVEKLARAGINVEYGIATTAGSGPGTAIFRVSDAPAAVKALK